MVKIFGLPSLFLAGWVLSVISFPLSAQAAETLPGSACSVAGLLRSTGGPEQIPGRDLVCDGAVWRLLAEKDINGTTLQQVGYDSGSCTADKAGRLRFSSAANNWEYCGGSDPWLPFKKPLCQDDDTGECLLAVARNSGDPDFVAANIVSGVKILGVTGVFSPVISPTPSVARISAHSEGSCLILSDGRAYCWGAAACASSSQCFNAWGVNIPTPNWPSSYDTITILPAPRSVYGGYTDWTEIYSGSVHNCGLRGGTAYCWGWNGDGQLGTGNNTTLWIPGLVAGGYTDWTMLALGGVIDFSGSASEYYRAHSCGIRSNGRLYCWGYNSDGQLGLNNTTSYNTPQEVSGAETDWAFVSAGGWHSCALKTNGRLYCWGWGGNGALGAGNTNTYRTPRQVSGSATDWAFVSAGGQHSCAIKTSGRLYCWGYNGNGELGNGSTGSTYDTPQEVSGAATDWAMVAAGHRFTCAIKTSGRLYCWGFGGNGQLGNGTTAQVQNTPVEVAGGYTDWVTVSAGGGADVFPTTASANNTWGRVCAIRAGGMPYCWGDGDQGLLGDGVFRRWEDDNFIATPTPLFADRP